MLREQIINMNKSKKYWLD